MAPDPYGIRGSPCTQMSAIAADIMRTDPEIAHIEHSCVEAAVRMRDSDVGVVFVADGDELVGTLTDRDIVTRVLAAGAKPSEVQVIDAMTKHVVWVRERTQLDAVATVMARERVRRLAVLNDDDELVGMINLERLRAAKLGTRAEQAADAALQTVSSPYDASKRRHRDDPAGGHAKGLGWDEGYAVRPRRKRGHRTD